MFSKREAAEPRHGARRLALFVAVTAATLAGVYAYVAPASTVAPAPLDDRPGVASNVTITPWSEFLSPRAVDSNGIERDLDGNASALVDSDPRHETR